MSNRRIKTLIAFIGLIASILGIIAFVTGKQSMHEFISIPAEEALVAATQVPVEPIRSDVINITGCSSMFECPDATPIKSLLGEGIQYDFDVEYKVAINFGDKIRFSTGWCTNDSERLLALNLERAKEMQ